MLEYIAKKLSDYAKDSDHYEFMDCLNDSEEDFYEQVLSLLRSEDGKSLEGLIDRLILDIEEDCPERTTAAMILVMLRRFCCVTIAAYIKIQDLDWDTLSGAIDKKLLAEKMQDVFEIVYEGNQPFATREENVNSVYESMNDMDYFVRAFTDINDFLDEKTLSDSDRILFGDTLGQMLVVQTTLLSAATSFG